MGQEKHKSASMHFLGYAANHTQGKKPLTQKHRTFLEGKNCERGKARERKNYNIPGTN